jgi:hypothetical protein
MRTPRKSAKKPTTKKSPPKPAASTASKVQVGHPPTARTAPQDVGGVVDPRAPATALGFDTAPRTAHGFQRNAFQESAVAKFEDAARTAEPISIVPTVYPQDPDGAITGSQAHVTINIHGGDFRKFKGTMVDLRKALQGVNAIAPEVRQQVIAETSAGTAILEAPKADRGLIDLLLIRPLKWLLSTGVGGAVTELAKRALDLLFKMMN